MAVLAEKMLHPARARNELPKNVSRAQSSEEKNEQRRRAVGSITADDPPTRRQVCQRLLARHGYCTKRKSRALTIGLHSRRRQMTTYVCLLFSQTLEGKLRISEEYAASQRVPRTSQRSARAFSLLLGWRVSVLVLHEVI